MNLQEAQDRLKKSTITEEQLWGINSLYLLLDFHKDDFCKVVDLLGLEKILANQSIYDRLVKAENDLSAKERYLSAKARLSELEYEKEQLTSYVDCYNPLG